MEQGLPTAQDARLARTPGACALGCLFREDESRGKPRRCLLNPNCLGQLAPLKHVISPVLSRASARSVSQPAD